MNARGQDGYWQCRVCFGTHVSDRVLSQIGHTLEMRRLVCESCGAVSHYDLMVAVAAPTIRKLNGRFKWVTEAEMAQHTGGRNGGVSGT